MQPERALRLLDALDGLACAARIVCAGHWGRRLRLLCVALAVVLGPLIGRLASV